MMKKNNFLMFAIIFAAISILVFLTFGNDNEKNKYNWETTFEDGKQQPYDFGLLKQLISHQTDKFEVIADHLEDKLKAIKTVDSATYLFIGRYCFYTKAEIDSILTFAASGRQVMLIAEQFPDTLLQVLQEQGKPFKVKEIRQNEVNIALNNLTEGNNNFNYRYRYFNKEMNSAINWNYLSEKPEADFINNHSYSRYLRLGTVNEHLNFAKFKLGKGYIFLHTNPILFTNYFLSNDTGFIYASQVFSELKTQHLLYDIAAREYKEEATNTIRKSDSPLSYILKQPALKWAWYLLITSTLLFFLFRAKREQRIIAIREQKKNTSLSFIETISGLYFQYNDHKKMTIIKMNLFTGFIRRKLGISTNTINPEILQQISTKAKVPLHDTEIIFYYYENLIKTQKQIDADDLINLNRYIETFYKYYNVKQKTP